MPDENEIVHGIRHFEVGELESMQGKAHGLCREFLGGAWRNVSVNRFDIQKIGGGLSNLLYLCTLPKGVTPLKDEPSRVLLRIYGSNCENENLVESHLSECIVLTMLSAKQRGPRLYGIFPEGRLEQYIPGRPLTSEELLDDELMGLIAEAFAKIHRMSVPLSKDSTYLWSTLDKWMTQLENYINKCKATTPNSPILESLKDVDLRAELRWMKNFLLPFESPVVFCHNDLQGGNILLKNSKTGEKSIMLIDFEYCAYNYRAFDMANTLLETMYDYSNEEFPYYWNKPDSFPSREKQARFAERYLQTMHRKSEIESEEIERLVDEVEAFILAAHFFWAVWGFNRASTPSSTIVFHYLGHAQDRLSGYLEQKKKLLEKYKNRSVENGRQ